MAKRSRGGDEPHGIDRVLALLDQAPAGLHDLAPPAEELPTGLPAALIELYARCDGGTLFIDTIELRPSAAVTVSEDKPERWTFGSIDGDDLAIDTKGRIWRTDASIDDLVCEGTRLDRWLAGAVDAVAHLYDADGEFADDVFDEDGELLPEIGELQLRAQLKRDPHAPGPRWRLAHALLAQDVSGEPRKPAKGAGKAPQKPSSPLDAAREQLEELVATEPGFAWGWLDLARISEKKGDLANALDEATAAAEAAAGHPQAGYFWSQVARIASVAGNETARATAAAEAQRLAPELKSAQLAGVRESLAAGDTASARGLIELLRAVWPRDLEVLDVARQLPVN